MKILMIGSQESGKTTFMASSFGLLEDGVSGFYLRTDDSSKLWLQKVFYEIKNGRYPSATDKRSSYTFSLYHKQQKAIEFEWIDYYGGVITEQSIDSLEKDIKNCDGVMIFLEAAALWENRNSVHRFRRILALITKQLENREVPLFTAIIVLTKYDQIPVGVSFEEVVHTIQPFLDSAQTNDRLYARAVPVSCTKSGFYNVELPLLDILHSGLAIEYLMAAAEAKAYIEMMEEYTKKIGIFDWIASRLVGVETNGESAERCRKMAVEKLELFQKLKKPTISLTEYIKNYSIRLPNQNDPSVESGRNTKKKHYIDL